MKKVNNKTFVREYMNQWSGEKPLREMAGRVGMSEASLYQRVSHLRERGVNLPKFDRRISNQTNVEDLNNLISRYQREA